MVSLVERTAEGVDLHKSSRPRGCRARQDRAPAPRRRRRPRIATPKADALVYELYGLSDAEIAIVEAGEASQSSYQAIDQFAATGYNLFGSYAWGAPTPDSDVDLLVILPFEGKAVAKSVEMRLKIRPSFSGGFARANTGEDS